MTKEEIMAAIVETAKEMGESPSRTDLLKAAGINKRALRKHFGTYQRALDACGLERNGGGRKVPMERLFQDWTRVAREVKHVPRATEYEQLSQYSVRPLMTRFGLWVNIPLAMKFYAEEKGLADDWKDVLEMVDRHSQEHGDVPRPSAPLSGPKILTDRPMYGLPLQGCPLVFAPTNEAGVVYLFGVLSERLGFLVLRVQTEFPDCEAMRIVDGNRMQWVRIEFEFESRNFLRHMHEPNGCDLIVCWEHNWPECPLEVVELREIAKIAKIG